MRDSRSILVLLVAFLFGLSFAVPAEDVPDTPYDESEVLPYESAPLIVIDIASPTALNSHYGFHAFFVNKGRETHTTSNGRFGCPISESLIILEHLLRC
jgi:hypothetical protein